MKPFLPALLFLALAASGVADDTTATLVLKTAEDNIAAIRAKRASVGAVEEAYWSGVRDGVTITSTTITNKEIHK